MTDGRSRSPESSALYALAGALLLGGPVWRYLFVNHYPFGHPEALLLAALALGLGAAVALAAHRLGGALESLGFGALLYLFVDLQFDLHKTIPTLPVVLACLLVSYGFRARRAQLTCLTLGGFYLSSLVRPSASPALARDRREMGPRDLPVLVHIVLDEQWGIGGMRAAGDPATADFLTRFYLSRGFALYEAAYSRWPRTLESIPSLVSLRRPVALQQSPEGEITLRTNPYFERLRQLGYAIHVFESSYVDYCRAERARVASCLEVPANSISNISYLRTPWTARALLAGRYLVNVTSHLYDRFIPDPPAWRRAYPGRGLAELGEVRDLLASRPARGSVIFVHLLLPHRPLTLNGDCSVYSDLGQRWSYGESWPSTVAEQRARLLRYGAQVRCAHRALAALFSALDRAVGPAGSIILVHGDHGSRWLDDHPENSELRFMRGPELNSAYSTLLAIRAPGIPGGLHSEPVPVQDFVWELADQGFTGALPEHWPHYVRRQPPDGMPGDTLRVLSLAEMPWVRQRR